MKNIEIEWCRNFIRKTFAKKVPTGKGIEVNFFFQLAEKSGLYVKGTYGSPMSQALYELVTVEHIQTSSGEYMFTVFKLKQ